MLFATLPRRRGPGDVESASFVGDRSIHAFPAAWVELVPAGVRDDQLHGGYEVLLRRVPFVCTWLPNGSRAPEDSASMFVRRYCRAVMLQASSRYCYLLRGTHCRSRAPRTVVHVQWMQAANGPRRVQSEFVVFVVAIEPPIVRRFEHAEWRSPCVNRF